MEPNALPTKNLSAYVAVLWLFVRCFIILIESETLVFPRKANVWVSAATEALPLRDANKSPVSSSKMHEGSTRTAEAEGSIFK